jgi:hypothetical protein
MHLYKTSRLRNVFVVICVVILVTLSVISLFILIGTINFFPQPSKIIPVKSNPTTISYTLAWQNQPGTTFSELNPATYQYVVIYLTIISASNFAPNSNITLSAYGTLSASFDNSSLFYIQLSYDGAVQYPQETGSGNPMYLSIVNSSSLVGGATVGVPPYLSLIGGPISIQYPFAGGPHYPSLLILYTNGNNLNQEFLNAPITITPQTTPTPQPSSQNQSLTIDILLLFWTIVAVILALLWEIYHTLPKKPANVPLK